MTSELAVYLRLGFEHILDPRGYDHILFVVALTAAYGWRSWRAVVVLVTAFTVGHSVTLALATVDAIRVPSTWVEWLIPVTILVVALLDLVEAGRETRTAARDRDRGPATPLPGDLRGGPREGPRGRRSQWDDVLEPDGMRMVRYVMALVFGLIHGLGFSGFLRSALGAESSIVVPLFAFNVGLEAGQLVIVAATLLAGTVVVDGLGSARRRWIAVVSGAVAALAVYLVVIRAPF